MHHRRSAQDQDPRRFARREDRSSSSRWQPRAPPFTREHEPSPTLMLRGLAPTVDDEMIFNALQAFRPVSARTMHDKTTGESRGFAFVDFDSVESAMEAVRTFASQPLELQNQVVSITYADSFRRRLPDAETARPRGEGSWGSGRLADGNRDQAHQGDRWQPRLDWICDECNVTNFARRTSCFQCNAPKTAHTKEVTPTAAFRTQRLHDEDDAHNRDENNASSTSMSVGGGERSARGRNPNDDFARIVPSHVLMVRLLPPDIEEGELHVTFAEFEGVQDIRLIRDRVTNLSRGFGFVEFCNIEAATQALAKCEGLVVHNTPVEVSFARDTLSTRSHYSAESSQGGPRAGHSMAVTALEQAQWSLAHGHGGTGAATSNQINVADDVSALLNSAAAEVVPHFEEPKKTWPPPFETAGGSYVYASEYGLYWDPDSMFYYDAQSKVYYNSFTGTYYRCVNASTSGAAAFNAFTPPLPVDDTAYTSSEIAPTPVNKPGLSLSLKKDKKKVPAISFGIKTAAFASVTPAFGTDSAIKAVGTNAVVAPTASAVGTGNVGMKRKSAIDIAKWSQRQREAKGLENESSSGFPGPKESPVGAAQADNTSVKKLKSGATAASDSTIDALTHVPQEAPICLLCRRKFGSMELLRKHEKLSKLHLANLAKSKENKQHIAAQYREHEQQEREAQNQRKQEERVIPGQTSQLKEGGRVVPDQTSQWNSASSSNDPPHQPAVSSLEAGIGGKMLKMMGWKSGEGLGKHGTGITAPIQAAESGRSETAGLGLKAPLSASVDLSDATSDKERRRMLARARYDAGNA